MRSSRRLKHELNVVPYIDVMLVLLVIFMVTAPLISQGNIDLPSVSNTSNKAVNHLEIQLTKDKKYNVIDHQTKKNSDQLNEEQLVDSLQVVEKSRGIVIAADKELPYGNVIALLDKIKKSGFSKISLLVHNK